MSTRQASNLDRKTTDSVINLDQCVVIDRSFEGTKIDHEIIEID